MPQEAQLKILKRMWKAGDEWEEVETPIIELVQAERKRAVEEERKRIIELFKKSFVTTDVYLVDRFLKKLVTPTREKNTKE